MKDFEGGLFLGGPVAETPCSQCRGPQFDPWSGNQTSHATTKSSNATAKILHAATKTRHRLWGGGSDGKQSACNARGLSSIPGSGRSPGGGRGNPLQCSCLENPTDRGAWRATAHGVTKSWTLLSD